MTSVQKGDKIRVEYTGSLEDGTVFDSSDKHDAPLEFIVGSGQIIKGFDEAVVGMEEGQEKEIILAPEDAYGQYNAEFVKELPKDVFPEGQEIQSGMVFLMNTPEGGQVPVKITDVKDDKVTVDLNPPLAGKTLIFKIKIVEINT